MDASGIAATAVGVGASALCVFLYYRMWKRQIPKPMAMWKAIAPAVPALALPELCGFLVVQLVFVPILSAMASGAEMPVAQQSGNPWLSSFMSSFVMAGFTEEFFKLLVILIAIAIIKPESVYEYALIGVAVGLGFTICEELLYAEDGDVISALVRLPFVAGHMVFSLIMGFYLGKAKHAKQKGLGKAWLYTLLALVLPVAWHTLYDMGTANNPVLRLGDGAQADPAIIFGVVVFLGSVIAQIVVLRAFKKHTEELCGLTIERAS